MDIYKNLREYGKPAAAVGSAGIAGFAAINRALEGDTLLLETAAEHSELIDQLGRQASGVFGSIAAEKGFSQIAEDSRENELAMYMVMITGAFAAGGLNEGIHFATEGVPDFWEGLNSKNGGIYAIAGQVGVDSTKEYNETDY